jgi:hypothetical protein
VTDATPFWLLMDASTARYALDDVQAGAQRSATRPAREQTMMSGVRRVQSSRRTAREWQLTLAPWSRPETVAVLESAAQGMLGEVWLHDEAAARVNMLAADYCSGLPNAFASRLGSSGNYPPMWAIPSGQAVAVRLRSGTLYRLTGLTDATAGATVGTISTPATSILAPAGTGLREFSLTFTANTSVASTVITVTAADLVTGLRLVPAVRTSTLIATNLGRYPGAEDATTNGWAASTGTTITSSTEQAHSGTRSYKVVTTSGAAGRGIEQTTNATYRPASSGTTTPETVSMWVYGSAGTALVLGLEQYNGLTFVRSAGTVNFTATGGWQRVSITGTKTVAADYLRAYVRTQANVAVTFYVDDALNEVSSTASPYFDGSTAQTSEYVYAWTGTANASTSTRRVQPFADLGGWAPGQGTPCRVQVLDPGQTLQYLPPEDQALADYSVTLREVGVTGAA